MKLSISLFILAVVASSYARDYIDPSKRQKQELLEEGQSASANSSTQNSQPAQEMSEDEKNRVIFCDCNRLDTYAQKAKTLAQTLFNDQIIKWEELDKYIKLRNKTEIARKKALHYTGMSESESETETLCEQDYNEYAKLKDFDNIIKEQVKKCKYFKY